MTPSLINLASPSPDTALPGNGNAPTEKAATQTANFANLLLAGLQDAPLGAETDIELGLPTAEPAPIALTAPELPDADKESAPDAPWPPEGLASLWLPAPDPAQPTALPGQIQLPAEPTAMIDAPIIDTLPEPTATDAQNTHLPGAALPPADTAPDAEAYATSAIRSGTSAHATNAAEPLISSTGPDSTKSKPPIQANEAFNQAAGQPPLEPEHTAFPSLMEQTPDESMPTIAARTSLAELAHSEAAPATILPAIPQPAHTSAPAQIPPASPTAPFPAPDQHRPA